MSHILALASPFNILNLCIEQGALPQAMTSRDFWQKIARRDRYQGRSGLCIYILMIGSRDTEETNRRVDSTSSQPGLHSGRLEEDERGASQSPSSESRETGLESGRLEGDWWGKEQTPSSNGREPGLESGRLDDRMENGSSPAPKGPRAVDQIQGSPRDTSRRLSTLVTNNSRARDVKEAVDQERVQIEVERSLYLEEMNQLRFETDYQQRQNKDLRAKLDQEAQAAKVLGRQLTEAYRESEKYAKENRALLKDIEKMKNDEGIRQREAKAKLNQELDAAKVKAQNFSKQVTDARNEADKLTDENRALRNERKTLDEEINSLRMAKQTYEQREQRYVMEAAALREELSALRHAFGDRTTENRNVSRDNNRLRAENAKFLDAINIARNALKPSTLDQPPSTEQST